MTKPIQIDAVKALSPEKMTLEIDVNQFQFSDTSALVNNQFREEDAAWMLQADAKIAAQFGLMIQQKSFNVLALGEAGTGRTTLMLNAMNAAATQNRAQALTDLVALYQFDADGKPAFLKLPAGAGLLLKQAFDGFVRQFGKALSAAVEEKTTENTAENTVAELKNEIAAQIAAIHTQCGFIANNAVLQNHLKLLQQEAEEYLTAWQPSQQEGDSHLESMLSEAFLGRYRVNLLVSNNKISNANAQNQPVFYDQDPSLHSLFGGIESAGENSTTPDFLRLRAGYLLRADGGMLLLHLRDILADEQNGAQMLEKLHRFCRNGTLQIEDLSSSSNQGASFISAQAPIPVKVKLVLIATREDYYALLEESPDFFSYFPIKVEFAEKVTANSANYLAYANFIAQKCQALNIFHFTKNAVAALLQAMHRLEEDQTRISTQLAALEKLMVESHTLATSENASLVDASHVNLAIANRVLRHAYVERYMRETIVDEELMINVQGSVVGQINALTHIDLADASFGSPVRITANCYAGAQGVVTIDREVTMSGPTHDKGVLILQSWLRQYFTESNPLNLTASIVFEQEYNGVDGDSASCAELFALVSSLVNVPIKQGFAVTGAMNQHGEVLPVGGLNEKIEGYFRVCQQLGLNGQQGVLMPERNVRHLMLNADVINAVKNGQFHIITMQHVLEGMTFLLDTDMEKIKALAETKLQNFKEMIEKNRPLQKIQNN